MYASLSVSIMWNQLWHILSYHKYINQNLYRATVIRHQKNGRVWIRTFQMFAYHDDIIKWNHFPRNWPLVRGIQRSPVNSPHKGQWRGSLMHFLICVEINGWVKNREAGDLRRYRAHYDVIVMAPIQTTMIDWDRNVVSGACKLVWHVNFPAIFYKTAHNIASSITEFGAARRFLWTQEFRITWPLQ